MRDLLKYAFLLALGAAIGAYIVFSLEDDVGRRAQREAAAAHLEPAPPATPTLAPADNEHDSGLSHRLGSLAPYAQSATAKVPRFPLAEKVRGSGAAEASTGACSETRAASEPTSPVSSPSDDVIPSMAAAAVSPDASQDTKPADEPTRPAAPPAGTDVAAGTQLATLTPEEVCLRDANRLTRLVTRLRVNPSRDEAQRFANELGCEELRPQLLALIEMLAPAPAAPDISDTASPDVQAENETAHPAAPLARADVAAQMSYETCKRDEDRLVRLRLSPSVDETQRFANELGCEKLRPQLQRLMESLDFAASASLVPAGWSHSNPLLGQACASERSALDRLRQEPSAKAAGLFWRDMHCEGLRPQVRLLLESLNVTPDSVGSAATPSEPEARGAF
jgi:hypothetical protein